MLQCRRATPTPNPNPDPNQVGGEQRPLTILEAVVRQTSSYARVRKGRCSVFWGDQVPLTLTLTLTLSLTLTLTPTLTLTLTLTLTPNQVFVPSCGVQQTDKAADILAALRPMPTKELTHLGQP